MRRTAPHKAASTLAPARKMTAAVTVAIASASLSEIGSGTGAPRGRVLEPIGPSPRPALAKSHRADSPRSSRHAECRAQTMPPCRIASHMTLAQMPRVDLTSAGWVRARR